MSVGKCCQQVITITVLQLFVTLEEKVPERKSLKILRCLEIGKAKIVHENDSKIVIFSFGNTFDLAAEISNELDTSLVDMRFIKPLDENLIERFANKCDHIISIEENTISGGAGSAVNEFLSSIGFAKKLKIFGIPDEFPIVGDQADQREAAGLTKIKILEKLSEELNLEKINKKVSA